MQAAEQLSSALFFLRPHAGVDFRHVDGTAGQCVALLGQAG